jgi:hypothetical protein
VAVARHLWKREEKGRKTVCLAVVMDHCFAFIEEKSTPIVGIGLCEACLTLEHTRFTS